jgi:hypothetical protein
MRTIKKINNWIIKEKREDEIPQGFDITQGYAVYTPDKVLQEDNLTYIQAVEFCKEKTDWIRKTNMLCKAI